MHVGCAKGRVGGCGGSNAPPEAKSSTSRRIAQRIRREVELLGLARTPGLDVDDLSSDRPKGALGSRHRARPRHFAQQTRRRHGVTAEEDVVALVDGRAISPRGTRIIEGTRPTCEKGTSSPGLASPPVRIPEVTECLGPDHSIRQGLVGEQPHLRLHQVCSDGCFSAKWMQTFPIFGGWRSRGSLSDLFRPGSGGAHPPVTPGCGCDGRRTIPTTRPRPTPVSDTGGGRTPRCSRWLHAPAATPGPLR